MNFHYTSKNKYFLFLVFLSFLILSACESHKRDPFVNQTEANGGVFYGGIFHFNETDNFRNLFPLNTIDLISFRVVSNVYEGLVQFSAKDLSIIPSLAESWEVNKDGTVFTFHIRKGVYYHDDECFQDGKGREINAHDFKYCFTKLCEADPNNQGFWVFKNRVKGADEYFRSTIANKPLEEGVTGIKVVDDYTLEIELTQPFAGFLNLLGTPFTYLFPKEAINTYGEQGMLDKCVGTGPFNVKSIRRGESVVLMRNKNYWALDEFGNRLPYLDAIKISFIPEKKAELLEFYKGNLDMAIPLELRDAIKEHLKTLYNQGIPFEVQTTPSLSIEYLRFLHTHEVFKEKLVRKAFNLAIDRQIIANFALKGEGRPAYNGFIPPAFANYNTKGVKGYEFDPDKAQHLMTLAGYPEGKGFPEIILHITSRGSSQQIASIIQKMLKENLNVSIRIVTLPLAQLIESFESGASVFWKSKWTADYPDPENFLNILLSTYIPSDEREKSHLNSERYVNLRFDSLLLLANRTIDEDARFELYQQADQVLMDDAVMMPLFYTDNYRLIKPYVKNFEINGMDHRDFRTVYFDRTEIDQE